MEQLGIYLGAQISEVEEENMSAEKYVGATVENVEQKLATSSQHLPTRCKTPSWLIIGQRLTRRPSSRLREWRSTKKSWGYLRGQSSWGYSPEAALMSTYLATPQGTPRTVDIFGHLKANS